MNFMSYVLSNVSHWVIIRCYGGHDSSWWHYSILWRFTSRTKRHSSGMMSLFTAMPDLITKWCIFSACDQLLYECCHYVRIHQGRICYWLIQDGLWQHRKAQSQVTRAAPRTSWWLQVQGSVQLCFYVCTWGKLVPDVLLLNKLWQPQ